MSQVVQVSELFFVVSTSLNSSQNHYYLNFLRIISYSFIKTFTRVFAIHLYPAEVVLDQTIQRRDFKHQMPFLYQSKEISALILYVLKELYLINMNFCTIHMQIGYKRLVFSLQYWEI